MAKKIFDIIPPGYSESKERRQSFDWGDKGMRKAASRQSQSPKKSSSFFKFFIILLFVSGGCAAAAYFLIGAKASVDVWPKQEPVAGGPEQVTVSEDAKQIDYERKIIPALLVEKTGNYSEAVSSTGAEGSKSKASGTIRLYNNFEPSKSFNFVKGTRFISSDGKVFKALSDIKLPEAKYDKGKLIEGYVDVKVEAAEGGSEYNIPASDFSLPGLSGTNSYAAIWGESGKAMEGGSETGVKMVTKEDIAAAEKRFSENAPQKAKQDLAAIVPSGYVMIDEFLSQEAAEEKNFSAKENDPAETLTVSGNITSKVLVFKESDISAYADNMISRTLSVKRVVPGSLKASYEGDAIDFSQKTAKLRLSASAKIYSIGGDEQSLKDSLRGQSVDRARSMLDGASGVEKVDIKVSPFWRKDIPADPSKLDVKIIFEEE